MIVTKINDTINLEAMCPRLKTALQWLRNNYASIHETGVSRVDIEDGVWANVETPAMKAIDKQVLEVHRKYIDIHVPVDKDEVMGWLPTHMLNNVVTPYSAERDIAFYNDTPLTHFTLHPGELCIMTPLDAHAPIIGTGTIKKICIKVAV
ncbi:YhcH/YjgK/YiaL family protein [Sodaliphilus sp.]|uniref:YhcH/YjgK/YiaL family protein n=1 Tax=Sodaliphilus sp. TaxID=2815818 RepID=UPI003890CA7E